PSPAFWVAVAMYAAAAAALLVVLGGNTKARPFALGLVAVAFVAHGIDIGWRGTQHVHPAQSVREAMGFLAFILTGGYLPPGRAHSVPAQRTWWCARHAPC